MDSTPIYSVPHKQGRMAKDKNGDLVLVNDAGKAFATNEIVLVIWQYCDGHKTINEIGDELTESLREAPKTFRQTLVQVVQKLANAKLVTLS